MKYLIAALALFASPLSAQGLDEAAMRGVVEDCIANAAPSDLAACALVATRSCIETAQDQDYAALACPSIEYAIWLELVEMENKRIYDLAFALEDRLYNENNDIDPQYLLFTDSVIEADTSWQSYVRQSCFLGAFADQLQRIDHPDPTFCMVQKSAARLVELRALAPHLE